MKTFLKKLNQLKLTLEIKVDLSRTRVIHQHKVIIIMTINNKGAKYME